ncbi:sugar kinase [Leifsonia sp. 21MFCrub1.1]|uniref:sugar kinase n=1 Tax=Leifsonia sp. 21MFCrub1.1 TaxID=1798223 RepID=UPI00089299AA|nr:sugar kinase [Leifsonia sp. 21MFCrub1.1]SEB06970.1 2-dehydro-3-deoxygluconokinase [Leifsonia sp. 21MFCrub1.1]
MRSAGLQVTIGEAMVVLYPEDQRPLAEADRFGSDVGGAEFNVATSLARLGLPTSWVSRLGTDGFGARIRRVAGESGVDTSAVELDPSRPTGLYVKETTRTAGDVSTRMHYHRSGSAASALSSATLASPAAAALLTSAELVHTSGITAALSPTAAEAVTGLRAVLGPDTRLSVDLNYRPQLWGDGDTSALTGLVAQADLLFLGRDEAEACFGHGDARRLFDAHPLLDTIVVKEDAHRASVHRRGGAEVHVRCLSVDVVEPIGAGDAFAAGFLCGLAERRDDAACLRLGHALAALALTSAGDRPLSVPDEMDRERIAGASDEEWASWAVRPGASPWRRSS